MRPTQAPTSSPTLMTVLQHVIADALSGVHTAFPAQIEKYDFTTAKADVKPLISAVYPDGSNMELPIIPNVPIVWPRTSLGSLSFPLQRGDGCLIVCAERSIDDWLILAGQNVPTDPRTFDLNDAIAIPGLYSFANQTKITGNNKFEIHYKEQQITIDENGTISLGGTTLQKLITSGYASSLETFLGKIVLAFSSLGYVLAPFVPPTNGTTSKVEAQ